MRDRSGMCSLPTPDIKVATVKRHDDYERVECERCANYLNIFISHLVDKFRSVDDSELSIGLFGLQKFIDNQAEVNTVFAKLASKDIFVYLENEDDAKHDDQAALQTVLCNVKSNCVTSSFTYKLQDICGLLRMSSEAGISLVSMLVIKIVASIIASKKIIYKCLVLDLDDTLWPGTLAEDGIEKIVQGLSEPANKQYINFAMFAKSLSAELGIFIAICSRNDCTHVQEAFDSLPEHLFPLKNCIDCVVADDNPKSMGIIQIAKKLSILPTSIVFIDDNPIVREEVRENLPQVCTLDFFGSHSELMAQILVGCLFDRNELSLPAKHRKRILHLINCEKSSNALPKLFVEAHSDIEHVQSTKMYAKTNQFKLTKRGGEFSDRDFSVYFRIVNKQQDDLGICAAITYKITETKIRRLEVLNWAISCRFFTIGLEEYVLLYLQDVAKKLNAAEVIIHFERTKDNLCAQKLFAKYKRLFNKYEKGMYAFCATDDIITLLKTNTNITELAMTNI
ncbi:MAG: HAD-IIIC family phosphatase [Coriobacteriales bacterium]|jgi:FkbH-like protein|nr:HAD-IIIC family phosphatase [Coriobacteriales bacterium]